MLDRFHVLVRGLPFAEGVRYSGGSVWFSDMYDRTVHQIDARSGEVLRSIRTPDRPSGLVLLGDGVVLVTQQVSRSIARIDHNGRVSTFADLSAIAEWHVNDMTEAPGGGVYVGNYGGASAPPAPPHPAALGRVSAKGTATVAAEGLNFANGMALVDDDTTLLVAETRSTPPRITSFAIGQNGALSRREPFAEFSGTRMPDGIAALPIGEVLVAMPFASEIVLLDRNGSIARTWETGSLGMPFAVAVDPESRTGFAAVSGSWEEEACLASRDSAIVAFPLDSA
ncbi:SMP-30/gluconolactonase/LRE family protein [Dietzia sp.]|uniref:SMP-30/gluconolactonase/LRE family protein n=1 Tax=Dietzia sp. TaxID=1871616 RepID=UPI002FD88265